MDSVKQVSELPDSSVSIRVDNVSFEVIDLKNMALKSIIEKGETISPGHSHMSLCVTPHDINVMCIITLSQGFDRPRWKISVGYDGKIRSSIKTIIREAIGN